MSSECMDRKATIEINFLLHYTRWIDVFAYTIGLVKSRSNDYWNKLLICEYILTADYCMRKSQAMGQSYLHPDFLNGILMHKNTQLWMICNILFWIYLSIMYMYVSKLFIFFIWKWHRNLNSHTSWPVSIWTDLLF